MLLHVPDDRLPVMQVKFVQNIVHMILDRGDFDAQLHGDLFVTEPFFYGTDNGLLTAGESIRGLRRYGGYLAGQF